MSSTSTRDAEHERDAALAVLLSIFEDRDPLDLSRCLAAAAGNVQRATEMILAEASPSASIESQPPRPKKRTKPPPRSVSEWLKPGKPTPSTRRGNTPKEKDASAGSERRKSQATAEGRSKPVRRRWGPRELTGASRRIDASSLRSINEVLKGTNGGAEAAARKSTPLPPLTLTSPQLVARHLPCCTLIPDALPKNLATRLYLDLVRDSKGDTEASGGAAWERNRWYLNDRLVESPHTTKFFAAKPENAAGLNYNECAQYWYAGRPLPVGSHARYFTDEMEESRRIIERIVNGLWRGDPDLLLRGGRSSAPERFDLEWEGAWQGNVLAANCYRGSQEAVGFHADQLTYLGPYPTIASLSLGTKRIFRLRATPSSFDPPDAPPPRTFNIELPHNCLVIMHPPCQEHFKHCVPPQPSIDVFRPHGGAGAGHTERINLTYRFYRPDFAPATEGNDGRQKVGERRYPGTPRCPCGVPAILRADQ